MKKLITITLLVFLASCSVDNSNMPKEIQKAEKEAVSLSREVGQILGGVFSEFSEGLKDARD